jgi:hypothetical protein
VKGPVPEGVVLNEAGVPGQLVRDVRAVAEALAKTVRVAQLVTLEQAPVT